MYQVIIPFGILAFIIFIMLILIYSGLFYSIKILIDDPSDIPEGLFLYKLYIQNYKTIGEAFRELKKFPMKKQHPCFGIYYDNPEVVDPDKTRSAVGIYFIGDEITKNKELIKNMEAVGYSLIKLPKVRRAVLTKFPYRTMLSIPIAMSRVYDRLMKYVKENRLHVRLIMEYYPHDGFIHFISPLDNHDAYIIKECMDNPPQLMVN